jgi:hypothetical protein
MDGRLDRQSGPCHFCSGERFACKRLRNPSPAIGFINNHIFDDPAHACWNSKNYESEHPQDGLRLLRHQQNGRRRKRDLLQFASSLVQVRSCH